jgi:hypothetical protein
LSDTVATAAEGKSCGSCTLCCKVMSITALAKPHGVWCSHCRIGGGCQIHQTKPAECTDFYCGYLQDVRFGEEWRPSKCKFVMVAEMDGDRVAIHVDPQRPDAWRQAPFYAQFKEWAQSGVVTGIQVTAHVGRRSWVILPDRDVDLGEVADDELIVTQKSMTPLGVRLDAVKMRRDDPRAPARKAAPPSAAEPPPSS